MTQRISDGNTISNKSKLISALNIALSNENISSDIPSEQFGFSAVIETDKTILKSGDFDFEFDIPFDDDMIPNESTITIYNLSNNTINNLKKGNTLTITAGYGTDTGIVLTGNISFVETKHDGVDKITTVYVLDDTPGDIIEETFEAGTAASYILKNLLDRLSLNIAVFEIQRDHIYDGSVAVKGDITDAIKTYADICGVSVYINKQQIYCRPIWQGDNIHFTVCSDTGMIGSPEPFEEEATNEEYQDNVTGYNINMLFQHRMTTAAITNVTSKDYQGSYRVCSGKHTFDGLSATTKIKCIENITTTIVETTTNNSGSSVVEADVYWAKQEVPLGIKNYPKTYMSYRLYTNSTASGYNYLWGNDSSTNSYGIRMYKDCICVAMGSYYGENGTFVKVEYTNPDGSTKTIICVKCDEKKDSETDNKNQYHPMNDGCGSVVEFIVDGQIITNQTQMNDVLKTYLGLEQKAYISNIWTTSTYPYTTVSSGLISSVLENIIKTAETEIGTAETGNNNNKYGAALGQNNVAWCGIFVGWCIKQVTGSTPEFSYASAGTYAYAARKNGWGTYHAYGSGYEPKRGDIFIENYDGGNYASHVGFVRSSSGSKFDTVEGNSSNKVNTQTKISASCTFVTPPY